MGKKLSDFDRIHNEICTVFDENKQRRLSDIRNKMKNELQERFDDFITNYFLPNAMNFSLYSKE